MSKPRHRKVLTTWFYTSLRATQRWSEFWTKKGGFGGGPSQQSHLATTYASLSALAIMGADGFEDAYKIIDRDGMKKFLGFGSNRIYFQILNKILPLYEIGLQLE